MFVRNLMTADDIAVRSLISKMQYNSQFILPRRVLLMSEKNLSVHRLEFIFVFFKSFRVIISSYLIDIGFVTNQSSI